MIPVCTGEGGPGRDGTIDHCCYLSGRRCPHLVENRAGRRFACGLMVAHGGDWSAMAADPAYRPIGEHWESIGQPFNYCETFDPAFCCRPEFRNGRANERSVI